MRTLLIYILAALPAAAQKDFLTPDEVVQIREAQEADARLQLYLRFARLRVEVLEQLFAKQKTGRSGVIHDTLEQYAQIIDAIDTWVDNSIKRQRPLTSLASVAKAEREMLSKLEQFAAGEQADKDRYRFVLDQAIDTTRDSIETNEQDLKTRTHAVEAREVEIRKEREETLAPERKEELKKEQSRIEAEKQGVAPGKKKPTLLRPGEKEKKDAEKK